MREKLFVSCNQLNDVVVDEFELLIFCSGMVVCYQGYYLLIIIDVFFFEYEFDIDFKRFYQLS